MSVPPDYRDRISLSTLNASQALVAVAVVLMVGLPLGGSIGVASAAPVSASSNSGLTADTGLTGTPALPTGYLVDSGAALVFVGAESWTAVWASAGNGSQVYSNALLLIAYDLRPTTFDLVVNAYQGGHGWVSNQSVLLLSLTETVITVNFVSDPNWQNVVLDIGGTPAQGGAVWVGQIATPISLLPPNVLNVGGLDILALGIISEGLVCFAGMTGLARILQRKARWAPKFSLLIWGHVIVVGIAAAVVLDYEWVDRTFAGWSPLVYAFACCPMMFLSALSWFNHADKAELLQRVARPQGKVLYRRWLLRFSVLPDGRTVLIDERWRGWLARVCGHHVVIDKGDEFSPVPFEGEVANMRSPTHSESHHTIADRFRVANPQEDEVALLWWTETGDPVMVKWPHLTIHRMKPVAAKLSPEGAVLVPAHEEKRLSLPHYTEAEVELARALEDYNAVEAVSARWANIRDLGRVLSKVKTALYALKAQFSAQVEAEVESRLVAYYSLIGKTTNDLTDEEAENLAKRGSVAPSLAELLDEGRLRASGQGVTPSDPHAKRSRS